MITTINTTLDIEELNCEGELVACFTVAIEGEHSASKGSRDEPDYEEMEITSCTLEDGDDYELSEADEDRAKMKLWEELKDSSDGY